MEEKYLKKQELRDILNVSQPTLDKMIKEGLPHYKMNKSLRFKLSEVEEYLKRN